MATAVSLKGQVQAWVDGKQEDAIELCEAVSAMHFGEGYAFAGLRDGRVLVRTAGATKFITSFIVVIPHITEE